MTPHSDAATGLGEADGVAEIPMSADTVVGTIAAPPGSLTLSPDQSVLHDAAGNTVYALNLLQSTIALSIRVPDGAQSSALCDGDGDGDGIMEPAVGAVPARQILRPGL